MNTKLCSQEEAEALGFNSPENAEEHRQWLADYQARHDELMAYQDTPEATARKADAAAVHDNNPNNITVDNKLNQRQE